MTETLPKFGPLVALSLSDPRAAARQIMGLGLAPQVRWQMLGVVVILSVVAVQLMIMAIGEIPPQEVAPGEFVEVEFASPVMMALMQGAALVLTVFFVHWIGRAFGGTGDLYNAISLVTWHQFLMLVLPIAGAALSAILPPLTALVFVALVAIYFYVFSLFVAELHGFQSGGMVFLGIMMSMFGVFMALAVLISIIALMAGVGGPQNV